MLRGRKDGVRGPDAVSTAKPAAPEAAGFPGLDQPYATDERPAGILFYHGRESFYLPYHLVQSMHCQPEQLTLTFATDDVVITGRGLHELYVQLAAQQVWRVVEQGKRYAAVSEAALFVASIERTTHSEE